MSRLSRVEHRFVDSFPTPLEENVLYVSVRFRTAAHLCACGCGNKVVTPLSPAGWSMHFDGDAVTLDPSIGSSRLPCRSHYFIRGNRIVWCRAMTDELTAEARKSDAIARGRYYGTEPIADQQPRQTAVPKSRTSVPQPTSPSLWERIRNWLR